MDIFQYHLNVVGWQGLQFTEHAKALAGTVHCEHCKFEFESSTDRVYSG